MNSEPDTSNIQRCAACACLNLRKASRAVTQAFDKIMQPSGVRATQFPVLAVLAMAGPMTITGLSQVLVMDRTTLARNLKPLEKQGLISTAKGEDRRTKTVTLTQKGADVLNKAMPMWEEAQNLVVERMGEDRWQSLLESLLLITSLLPLEPGAASGESRSGE